MDEESFRKKLRENKIKVTPQRIAIYRELVNAKDHPSTDNIFKKIRKCFPKISFDTVNRTVLTFVRIDLIRIVEGGGRRFDPNTGPHHHLRCIQCYSIIDFYSNDYDQLKLPKKIPGNFTILSKKVILEGVCEKCSNQKTGDHHVRRKRKK